MCRQKFVFLRAQSGTWCEDRGDMNPKKFSVAGLQYIPRNVRLDHFYLLSFRKIRQGVRKKTRFLEYLKGDLDLAFRYISRSSQKKFV